MAKPKQKVVFRDAVDGQFIKKQEADKRPREAIREHVPVGKPKPKKKGK